MRQDRKSAAPRSNAQQVRELSPDELAVVSALTKVFHQPSLAPAGTEPAATAAEIDAAVEFQQIQIELYTNFEP